MAGASLLLFGIVLWHVRGGAILLDVVPGYLLAGALCYVLSHLMRAIRLSAITAPFVGISFRTAIALHFSVAPLSLLAPFKLDELLRLNELNRVGGAPARSVATILIDRSMDGLVLVLLGTFLLARGRADVAGLSLSAGLALTVVALAFVILPPLLASVQRHLFVYNFRNEAIALLRTIDRLQQLLLAGRHTIVAAMPFLFLTTLGIWTAELLAVGLVLAAFPDQSATLLQSVELMLIRVELSWRALAVGQSPGFTVSTVASVLFFVALLPPWAVAATVYARRQGEEPRRRRLTGGRARAPLPLFAKQ